VGDAEDHDVEFPTFVLHSQHIANANVTGGFGLHFVRPNPAKVAGLSCQSARLEETRGPEPLVDAYRFLRLIAGHGIMPVCRNRAGPSSRRRESRNRWRWKPRFPAAGWRDSEQIGYSPCCQVIPPVEF